jgi:manganese-dependent ADP-ribose/CDP-alcohol diphosphatase
MFQLWRIFFLILLLSLCSVAQAQEKKIVHIGFFTDCQYCNCPDYGARCYQLSLLKLDSCIEIFNSQSLDAVFHLGDMIDHDYGNYDSVLPRFAKFSAPFYKVLGNHDYMISKEYKAGLKDRLGLKEGYYRVDIADWSFIVLNGDDLSYFAPQTGKQRRERNDMVGNLYSELRFNGMIWNGGIGSDQMKWLEEELKNASALHRNVIVLCHFPLFSKEDHNLFNNLELFDLLKKNSCVKAYFNGHYHDGHFQILDEISLVNFKGMVNTHQNSFSVVTLTSDSIFIKGYGREPDRRLGIR